MITPSTTTSTKNKSCNPTFDGYRNTTVEILPTSARTLYSSDISNAPRVTSGPSTVTLIDVVTLPPTTSTTIVIITTTNTWDIGQSIAPFPLPSCLFSYFLGYFSEVVPVSSSCSVPFELSAPNSTSGHISSQLLTASVPAIYATESCSPEGNDENGQYYVLNGPAWPELSNSVECISFPSSNYPTDMSDDTKINCRFFTDGGTSWTGCSATTFSDPKSWRVKGGRCQVFISEACANDEGEFDYYLPEGCHTFGDYEYQDMKNWRSTKCFSLGDAAA